MVYEGLAAKKVQFIINLLTLGGTKWQEVGRSYLELLPLGHAFLGNSHFPWGVHVRGRIKLEDNTVSMWWKEHRLIGSSEN